MKEIKIINKSTFLDKEIDVWGSAEQPLFRAKDVSDWLNLKNTPEIIKRIDTEERHKFNLGRNGGDTWFLTEDGLYELLMQSRKPIAKQFKKGVKKILHEIRKKAATSLQPTQTHPRTSWLALYLWRSKHSHAARSASKNSKNKVGGRNLLSNKRTSKSTCNASKSKRLRPRQTTTTKHLRLRVA